LDAEGFHERTPCPVCESEDTVTFYYDEGFTELECPACGYRSDAEEIAALHRFAGDVLEKRRFEPAIPDPKFPLRSMKA